MKQFSYCLVLSVVLLACAASKNTARKQLKGSWELSVFPTTDKTFAELFGQRRPELVFDGSQTVSGNTGCNRFSGTYTLADNEIHLGENLTTTKMACPGYEESIFLDALKSTNRVNISDGQLRLLHDSTLVMVFVKKER